MKKYLCQKFNTFQKSYLFWLTLIQFFQPKDLENSSLGFLIFPCAEQTKKSYDTAIMGKLFLQCFAHNIGSLWNIQRIFIERLYENFQPSVFHCHRFGSHQELYRWASRKFFAQKNRNLSLHDSTIIEHIKDTFVFPMKKNNLPSVRTNRF